MPLTSLDLKQVSSRGRTPKIDWARVEEASDFAKTVNCTDKKNMMIIALDVIGCNMGPMVPV